VRQKEKDAHAHKVGKREEKRRRVEINACLLALFQACLFLGFSPIYGYFLSIYKQFETK
jgi:hypothetical protein